MHTLRLDYETQSMCDLKLAGAYAYARDPSTRVLCACYMIDDGPIRSWDATCSPLPKDLRAALEDPAVLIHAWNAGFERNITTNVLKIPVPLERYRCTAAHARARGLPGKLDTIGNVLKLTKRKDRAGHLLMLRLCRPDRVTGKLPRPTPGEMATLIAYCRMDVAVELQAALQLPPLTERELEDYQVTERMNDAGLPIDRALAVDAQRYAAEEAADVKAKLVAYTDGRVSSSQAYAQLKAELRRALGAARYEQLFIRDGKETTDQRQRAEALAALGDEDEYVRELLELIEMASSAAVAKFARMAAGSTDQDPRVRGAYTCFGAARTKRHSSQGLQVHNLPRDKLEDLDNVIACVHAGAVIPRTMWTLSRLLRPTIMAPKGRTLVWGDWSAIEARTLPWFVSSVPGRIGHQAAQKLDLYARGVDVYVHNAQRIYGSGFIEGDKDQRQAGKVAELSLQFGGAVGAFSRMARNYGLSLSAELRQSIVNTWRNDNPWCAWPSGIWGELRDAFNRVMFLRIPAQVGSVRYEPVDLLTSDPTHTTVKCTLPSGTVLWYVNARMSWDKKGNRTPESVTGQPAQDQLAHRPVPRAWDEKPPRSKLVAEDLVITGDNEFGSKASLWYGLLAENLAQAIAADVLSDTLFNLMEETQGTSITLVGSTHDEILLECDTPDTERAKTMLRDAMETGPIWAQGLPLKAEISSGSRYGK